MVDSSAVRKKLSKQLKIDLESYERVHLYKEAVSYGDYNEKATEELMGTLGDSEVKCEVQIKKMGDYIARITLRGGYSVPLRFEVTKR
jgi:ribosomal protein L9